MLLDVLKGFGKIYSYDTCMSKTSGTALESAMVAEKSCVVMQAVTARDCLCEQPIYSLECELLSIISESMVHGSFERRGETFHSLYNIYYTPVEKGRHQLHIKVEGRHIRGSPFSVVVKSNDRMEDLISSIHELNWPTGITVSDDGKVIVTENEKNCVIILSLHGHKVTTFGVEGVNEGQLVDPRGIATDPDGNLLVVDAGNRRLQKFSPEGSFLTVYGGDEFDFNYPTNIAFNSQLLRNRLEESLHLHHQR